MSEFGWPPAADQRLPLALVTGAARRVGRFFALALARKGYAVGVHYAHAEEEARRTVEEIRALGVPAYPLQANLTQVEAIEALFRQVDALGHPLRVLVNSAAIMPRETVDAVTVATWDAVMALNLRAPFLCSQQAARRMKDEGGVIVQVTDAGTSKVWTAYPVYLVSKAALEKLTQVLARAWAPKIRVNALALGLVLPPEGDPAVDWDHLVQHKVPLGRAATPEDLAKALAFLLEHSYVTGQILRVDGGFSLV